MKKKTKVRVYEKLMKNELFLKENVKCPLHSKYCTFRQPTIVKIEHIFMKISINSQLKKFAPELLFRKSCFSGENY